MLSSRSVSLCLIVIVTAVGGAHAAYGNQAAVERGKYLFDAGGCAACHTDEKGGGEPLAGGPALKTPFGTFYAPNITPDPEHGIARWTDEDFLKAMREGVGPGGQHYYPVFPYTSYSKATERDLLDVKAYIFTLPPVAKASQPHDVGFPFSYRPILWIWKLLNFDPAPWRPDPTKGEAWNRGSYLVEALSHCGECHTPRNMLGGLDRARWLAGAKIPGENSVAPNLTPHKTGLASWKIDDITFALDLGITPKGEAFGKLMGTVVDVVTGRLSAVDREAIAVYLKQLPPLPSAVERKKR